MSWLRISSRLEPSRRPTLLKVALELSSIRPQRKHRKLLQCSMDRMSTDLPFTWIRGPRRSKRPHSCALYSESSGRFGLGGISFKVTRFALQFCCFLEVVMFVRGLAFFESCTCEA